MQSSFWFDVAIAGAIALLLAVLSVQADLQTNGNNQLDRSGWKKLESGSRYPESHHKSIELQKSIRGKNFVEWDDDDLNDGRFTRSQEDFKLDKTDHKAQDFGKVESAPVKSWRVKSRDTGSKFNRLIYHGQLNSNETTRVVDGIKLHINLYKPVSIIRRPNNKQSKYQIHLPERTTSARPYDDDDDDDNDDNRSNIHSVHRSETKQQHTQTARNMDVVPLAGSGSDWKPIVVAKQSRLNSTVALVGKPLTKKMSNFDLKPTKTLSSSKWKPVSRERKLKFPMPNKDDGHFTTTLSSISEPFEDSGLVTARFGELEPSIVHQERKNERRESKSMSIKKVSGAGWTPVELVNGSFTEMTTTTTMSPTTTTNVLLNSSEPAQRSASDLNYIYSQAMQSSQSSESSRQPYAAGSYYSSYLTPPVTQPQQVVEQPQQPAIVDTTSGQAPEMIADRQPEVPQTALVDYSSQAMSSLIQQPVRTPTYASYDIGSNYAPPRAQPQPQSTRQPQPQIVRQEHHYHYYNSQSPQRQQTSQEVPSDRSQTSQIASQQPIIREIQPLLISQPIVQQQPTSSTTQAPQIIREIIKEVPVASTFQQIPIPIPRIIAPPPIAIPLSPASRELDPIYSFGNPTQRIIRQISGSVPTVSFRAAATVPVVPQIRLPVPTIQLPVRLAPSNNLAPITRQTGSFLIPPIPKKTTTYLTETQAMPTHTTIMHTTQFTPATRTTVFTTDHQASRALAASSGYRRK